MYGALIVLTDLNKNYFKWKFAILPFLHGPRADASIAPQNLILNSKKTTSARYCFQSDKNHMICNSTPGRMLLNCRLESHLDTIDKTESVHMVQL